MEEIAKKVGVREGYGVLIAQVIKETPAEASGLREGDLVVAIDGRPIVETRALQRLVGAPPAGRELGLVVLREHDRQELKVRVGRMPAEVVADRVAFEFGFFVRDVAEERTGVVPELRPPVVAGVAERSSAARGGLRTGDRILAVNDVAAETVEAFRRRAQELYLRDPVRLRVDREGESLVLTLPPAEPPRR
jgi:serine protease Do